MRSETNSTDKSNNISNIFNTTVVLEISSGILQSRSKAVNLLKTCTS